ncbi:PREDICTED: nudC domain-containing protein 1 [Polistes dominula]|uniref:NudC domain-containing protein 1 n=1 Tax=Polistes dominula TaxID=743375 RepID=A0ABM1IWV9_POLDO|nr:PREDICTED: nudC domain-containing protein 1 [Polistes dominula]
MTKIIELRPDRSLLNPRFEKYQFSPDIVPVKSEISLENDVYRLELNPDQESWLEVRLFALHNHLFTNPYDTSCWFIDKEHIIWRVNKIGTLQKIYKLRTPNQSSKLLYNPSIGFTSNNIVVISNGGDSLYLLKEDHSGQVEAFLLEEAEPGVILDIRYVQTKSQIIIALSSIVDDNGKKCTKLVLLFYTLQQYDEKQNTFHLSNKQVLKVRGTVEYVFIEENGDHLHSICQNNIIFESDNKKITENSKKNISDKEHIKIPKYCWSQDEDSLTVWVKIPEKYYQSQAKVNVKSNEISITVNDDILIQGECQHRLDEKLTTWKHEKDTLQLDLIKFENGLMWNELIKGDTGGECLPNESLAAEIHSRLAHLCSENPNAPGGEGQPFLGFNSEQLEECDIEGKENIFQRINLTSQEITHQANLGTNNHVLFTNKMKFGQTICLRHDHDGCLWITDIVKDNVWNIKHTTTFPGFGYVEASKSNKKFCICSPDGSYVAIIEHKRHVFLYERPENNSQISKQWIVDLEYDSPSSIIMGAVATNKYLIILTKNKLYHLQIYP